MSVPYGENFWSKVLNKPAAPESQPRQQQPRPPRSQQHNQTQKQTQPPKQPEQVAKNKLCKVCGSVGHTAQSCPDVNKFCNNCGTKGHVARNCTLALFDFPRYKSVPSCSICHQEGHEARDCPNKRPPAEHDEGFRPVREKKGKKKEQPQETQEQKKEGDNDKPPVKEEDKDVSQKQADQEVVANDSETKNPEVTEAKEENKGEEGTKPEEAQEPKKGETAVSAPSTTENGTKTKKKKAKKAAKKPAAPPAWVIEEPELEQAQTVEASVDAAAENEDEHGVEYWKSVVEELRAELAATKEREEQLKKQVSELQKKKNTKE